MLCSPPSMTTSKLQRNYRTTTLEKHLVEQKSNNYKKEATSRLVEGAEKQNGLVPHPGVVVKNREEYLGCRGPPWE